MTCAISAAELRKPVAVVLGSLALDSGAKHSKAEQVNTTEAIRDGRVPDILRSE